MTQHQHIKPRYEYKFIPDSRLNIIYAQQFNLRCAQEDTTLTLKPSSPPPPYMRIIDQRNYHIAKSQLGWDHRTNSTKAHASRDSRGSVTTYDSLD